MDMDKDANKEEVAEVEVKTEPKSEEPEPEDSEIIIPSILDSISQEDIDNFKPFHERYFQKMYCTKFSTDNLNLDTCIRVHSNKICLVFLSEKHALFQNNQRIESINFQVSVKVNRLKNKMSGKGKRGAQVLSPDSVLCYIHTPDGAKYPVHAGICGKLLEINSRVIENPNYLIEDLNEGFLAIILPNLNKHEENINSLIKRDDYNT